MGPVTALGEPGIGYSAVELDEGGRDRWRPVTNIVVGVERSSASLTALGKGAEIGGMIGAGLRVVHAIDLSDYPLDPDPEDWEAQANQNVDAEREAVSEALAGYPGKWSFLLVRAGPVEALVAAAQHYRALMIVVGARCDGRQRLERMAHRPVWQRLVGRTSCPVVVVPYPSSSL